MAVTVGLLLSVQVGVVVYELNVVTRDLNAVSGLTSMHIKISTSIDKAVDARAQLIQLLRSGDLGLASGYQARRADLRATIAEMLADTSDPERRKALQDVVRAFQEVDAAVDECLAKLEVGELEDADLHVDIIDELHGEAAQGLVQLALAVRDTLTHELPQIGERAAAPQRAVLIVSAIILAIIVLGSMAQTRHILRSMGVMLNGLQRVREGHLDQRVGVAADDELGKMASALNDAVDSMRTTIRSIIDETAEMDERSGSIQASSHSLSEYALGCSSALEEISARLQQVTAAVGRTSDHTRRASELATGANESAARGVAQMEELGGAMHRIRETSQEVSQILGVIDNIAFETNLLALNASVEAARAGDAGRGFSIVAQEVRALAGRCARAATETAEMIARANDSAESGDRLATSVAESLRQILTTATEVNSILTEISGAAAEQSGDLRDVMVRAEEVKGLTVRNSAGSQELATMALDAAGQSTSLRRLVSQFRC